jgi:hypothetical protein
MNRRFKASATDFSASAVGHAFAATAADKLAAVVVDSLAAAAADNIHRLAAAAFEADWEEDS